MNPLTEETENRALIVRGRYDLTVPERALIERGLLLAESLAKSQTSQSKIVLTPSELLTHIYRFCEKSGATHNVGPEYYNWFLNIEQGMERLIECILRDRGDYINRQCLSKKWTNDEEIYEHVMFFLDLIARGIMCIGEEDGRLGFLKPVGSPPDPETELKIEQKIKSTIPLIEKAVLKAIEYTKKMSKPDQ